MLSAPQCLFGLAKASVGLVEAAGPGPSLVAFHQLISPSILAHLQGDDARNPQVADPTACRLSANPWVAQRGSVSRTVNTRPCMQACDMATSTS
jgi:hypothetical protein